MPKIAQYEPDQVTPQVARQPRAQGALPGTFDSPIVSGVSKLVQSGIDFKKRIDTTTAEEALVQFERDKNDVFFNPDTGYFNSQGRDAYDNSSAAVKSLDALRKKYSDTLNPQSKMMFDKVASAHVTRGQLDISRHAAKGLNAWEVGTLESQVENTIENASLYWNDPDQLKVQKVLGRQAIFDSAKMMGLGFEATAEKVQTYESVFAKSTIEAATQSSAADGKAALSKYGTRLEGPIKLQMDKLIDRKTAIEKTQSDAIAAVTTASRLNGQYGDRGDMIDEVNKIKDEDLRKKTMAETMSQFSRKKQAESETRANSFEDAETHIIKGGSSESFKAVNPEEWETLSAKQQRSIESGIVSVTDWNVFSDLMLLPKNELAKVDPTEHFSKLAKAERSRLISAVKSANGTGSQKDKIDHQTGRTRNAQTTAAVETLFGRKNKWSKQKREQANGFYALLDDEVNFRESEKEGKLTSEEFTNLLSGLTRTTVQEGFFFDSEFDLSEIPAEDVPVLSKFLRDNKIPVTSDNILKAFKQASE